MNRTYSPPLVASVAAVALAAALLASIPRTGAASPSFAEIVQRVQPKMVKIYGAGGVRGLEAYQSGFLFTGEGHVLTVWSTVLDTDLITVVLNDGRRFEAEFVGTDPRVEIAVLRVDVPGASHFNLDEAVTLERGDRVLALSNLYGVATGNEPASVLHGRVAAVTSLKARRGVYKSPYKGPVYVLDAMTNNPGAAGGALIDREGQLVGLLGKELRNSLNNTWLNFAVPIDELAPSVDEILTGRTRPRSEDPETEKPPEPLSLQMLGIYLVPDVLRKTPPFVDRVRRDSVADQAGIEPDDLILYVNDRVIQSCRALIEEIGLIDRSRLVRVLVMRDQELIEVELKMDR